ncbi:hypothetical protein [Metabacillus iocasae]|uniref:Phage-related protein n=1 Tax=Priestia iocasae TaxID=2291674 RepID=A0ABS2R098_9BACI|nr:hypothetical protein [Metabacillus iocasae]MBM7704416.1 phage-related protein [Metabacillus iocasae]
MVVVHFIQNNVELLNQLCRDIPAEGSEVKVKGRKGKVMNVKQVDEKHIHVEVELEVVKKNVPVLDPRKKKR